MAASNQTGVKGLQHLSSVFTDGPGGSLEGQQTSGINNIADVYSSGFTPNMGQFTMTTFLGIEGSVYENPGGLGTVSEYVNWIPDIHGFGFVPWLNQGDDTLFNGILDKQFTNPGLMWEVGNTTLEGQMLHGINNIANLHQIGFTPGREHKDNSEFIGTDFSTPELPTFLNPGVFGAPLYDEEGIGIDWILNQHATGFTKLRQHKDPSEFTIVSNSPDSTTLIEGGTLYNRFTEEEYPFGTSDGANKYAYVSKVIQNSSDIDPDNAMLIQQGGVRSVGQTGMIQGVQVTDITLEEIYNKHIGSLIDFESVSGKTDSRLSMTYDGFSGQGMGGFLPLTFSRGTEPYIVSPIGGSFMTNNIVGRHVNDGLRLLKYMATLDGVKFIGLQNAFGIGAYLVHRSVKHGTEPLNAEGTSPGGEVYSRLLSSLAGGKQQFQYTYNPLSIFSQNIPFIKIHMNRSFLLDEQTYIDRDPGEIFGIKLPDITPNRNSKLAKGVLPEGVDDKEDDDKGFKTTLGGFLKFNVNTSMDGTPINVQGIAGDRMTLAPIADKENINLLKQIFPDGNMDSIEHGYPFYFKDLRNDRLLVFRGYIEDMNENVQPNWNSETYIGRSEPVHTYSNTTRDLNFTLKMYPNNHAEFKSIYEKLDYLTSMCYPEYFKDDRVGYTRPKPPLARFRLADLYGSSKFNETSGLQDGVLGYINSINYTYDGPWEHLIEGERAPRNIAATIGYTIIGETTPSLTTQFYGPVDSALPPLRPALEETTE